MKDLEYMACGNILVGSDILGISIGIFIVSSPIFPAEDYDKFAERIMRW